MIDDIMATLEECKEIFAELVLEGEIVTMDRLATGLALITQLESRLNYGDIDLEDVETNAAVSILQKNLGAAKEVFKFENIDPSVLEAVYSACDSAETGTLSGWEMDLIESRIVTAHGGKTLLTPKT